MEVVKTTSKDLIAGIIAQKNASGMTNQQIAEAANISRTTVDRALRNEDDKSPNLQTILAIANAVGYPLEREQEVEKITENDAHLRLVRDLYEDRIRQLEDHYNRTTRTQSHWIYTLAALCVLLFVFIIGVLLYDITHPNVGWIRDHLQEITGDSLRDVLLAAADWWVHIFA